MTQLPGFTAALSLKPSSRRYGPRTRRAATTNDSIVPAFCPPAVSGTGVATSLLLSEAMNRADAIAMVQIFAQCPTPTCWPAMSPPVHICVPFTPNPNNPASWSFSCISTINAWCTGAPTTQPPPVPWWAKNYGWIGPHWYNRPINLGPAGTVAVAAGAVAAGTVIGGVTGELIDDALAPEVPIAGVTEGCTTLSGGSSLRRMQATYWGCTRSYNNSVIDANNRCAETVRCAGKCNGRDCVASADITSSPIQTIGFLGCETHFWYQCSCKCPS